MAREVGELFCIHHKMGVGDENSVCDEYKLFYDR